ESPSGERHDAALTVTGTVLGTPRYMAPEQTAGGLVDARSDQYSLCASLWEALGGQLPAMPGDVRGSSIGDARLRAIVARALGADPAARWRSLDELLAALAPEHRRRGRLAVAAGIAAAGAAVAVAWMVRASHDADTARRRAEDDLVRQGASNANAAMLAR